MSKYLLSLDQNEFLVKTPLTETSGEGNYINYTCNLNKKVVHIGIADTVLGLEKLPIEFCNIAEIYIRDFLAFDFSILSEEDFHDQNQSFFMKALIPRVDTAFFNQFYGRKGPLVCSTGENGSFGLNVEGIATEYFYCPDPVRVIGSSIYDGNGYPIRETAVNDWSADSSQIYIMSHQGLISEIKSLGQDC